MPKNSTMVESTSSDNEGTIKKVLQKNPAAGRVYQKIGWKVALKFLSIYRRPLCPCVASRKEPRIDLGRRFQRHILFQTLNST